MKLLSAHNKRKWIFSLLLFVFLNGLLWSLIIPFDGAPDEIHKYEVAYFIWKNHRVPVFGQSADLYIREAPGTRDGYVYGAATTYPCGAYLLSALFMHLAPSDLPIVLLHTARLTSLIYAVFTIYFIYKIIHALFKSVNYALGVAAFTALIPQFTYTGAYVNDDAYQIMAVTWTIWVTIKGVRDSWVLKDGLCMGLALALVSLGKQNGWIAVFPFVLFSLVSTWRRSWDQKLKAWASMYLPPFFTLGSWLTRNWLLYHDPLALQVGKAAWQDYISRIEFEWVPLAEQGYGFLDLLFETRWLRTTFESFWGRFFYMNVTMDTRIYSILLLGCVSGVIATIAVCLRYREKVRLADVTISILTCAGLAFTLMFIAAIWTSLYNDYQPQGRYFFPMIVFIAMFLTLGIHVLSKTYLKQFNLLRVILVFLFALNIFSLVRYIYAHPYPEIPLPNF